jgi:flagellar biosynthesis anti-sigma factor FlgM
MQKASQIVAQTPEVRSEKIGPLQESIRQGSYAVDSSKVASKMITQGLFGG